MGNDGAAFCDDDAVFQTYLEQRQHPHHASDRLEQLLVMELPGDFRGTDILDLEGGNDALGHQF